MTDGVQQFKSLVNLREIISELDEWVGRTDNSDMLADVHYEVTVYLAERGYEGVWETVSDAV